MTEARQSTIPPVLELAEKIKSDIRDRHLRPGDAYMSTQEVAKRFRVNGTTANRALQLLTQRGMLLRRQRTGTLVAEPARIPGAVQIGRVHLFVHKEYLKSEGLLGDGTLVGLQRALPNAEIQFNYLPPLEEVPSVEKVIAEVLRKREPAGFVLYRSPASVQRLCESRGIPTVVSGTLQPSIRNLASIDRDQRQIGVLLSEYLMEQQCSRIAIFMRELLTAGDHVMLDAIFATLSRLGLPLARACLRCISHDSTTVKAEVASILSGDESDIGFLCRSEPLARGIGAALQELNVAGERKRPIAVADYWRQGSEELHYPHIQSTIPAEQWGEKIGEMLLELSRKIQPETLQALVPVKLILP